jgi:aldose 1-epimerase
MTEIQPIADVIKRPFGTLPNGREVELFLLTNDSGMRVEITPFGGIVTSITTADRNGRFDDVVLGFDDLSSYLAGHPYFGAIIGRYANRIAKGKFSLDGKIYTLARNNAENHLHGGESGFSKALWEAEPSLHLGIPQLRLTRVSDDGEEGYPGKLDIRVDYTLTSENELQIDYRAATDKPTHVNLTNHSYFNLAGAGRGGVLGHEVQIDAGHFTPVDDGLIPTGEVREVEHTPFDFRRPMAIGSRIEENDEQLRLGQGYDHNFVLNRAAVELSFAARVSEPTTGRVMEVYTTEPGLQFYSGNFLDGTITGKRGQVYSRRCAFCLETQHFPDSPNRPDFPTTVVRPGKPYRSTTVYSFSAG